MHSTGSGHSGKHCIRVLIGALMIITGALWIAFFNPPTLLTSLLVLIGAAVLV